MDARRRNPLVRFSVSTTRCLGDQGQQPREEEAAAAEEGEGGVWQLWVGGGPQDQRRGACRPGDWQHQEEQEPWYSPSTRQSSVEHVEDLLSEKKCQRKSSYMIWWLFLNISESLSSRTTEKGGATSGRGKNGEEGSLRRFNHLFGLEVSSDLHNQPPPEPS